METVKYVMTYWSPSSLKTCTIWATVVFALAENTAQSISLGFDTHLVTSNTQSQHHRFVADVHFPLIFAKALWMDLLCPFSTTHGFIAPPFVFPPSLHWCVAGCGSSRNTFPFWLTKGGQLLWGRHSRAGRLWCGSTGEMSLARLWMKCGYCRACLGAS